MLNLNDKNLFSIAQSTKKNNEIGGKYFIEKTLKVQLLYFDKFYLNIDVIFSQRT